MNLGPLSILTVHPQSGPDAAGALPEASSTESVGLAAAPLSVLGHLLRLNR